MNRNEVTVELRPEQAREAMLISGWKQRERWYWDSRIGVMMFPHGRQVGKAYSTVGGGGATEVL